MAGWRLQRWQLSVPTAEQGWNQVFGETGFKLTDGFSNSLLLLILGLHSSFKKHHGPGFPAVSATKELQKN